MVYESILPNVQHQKRFVLLIHLQGLWISVDIWHALVWVDREKENHAHWSLSAYRAGVQAIVRAGMCLFTHLCVCLFPGAPERKPARSGPSRFTSVRSWNCVLTSLCLLITCPWPPLPHRWLSFICRKSLFIMHSYYGHSQRHPLLELLLQYSECFDKNILYENDYHKVERI